jgi:hypothetical protein
MNNTISVSGSFVKDMLLEQFSQNLSKTTLTDSLQPVVQKKVNMSEDESITLVVFASKSQSEMKINALNYGQAPLIRNQWPIAHATVLKAFATRSETLLPDLLIKDVALMDSIALLLPTWSVEYERCKLKDKVGLVSPPSQQFIPPAL